jgi:cytochrome c oxidase subunit 2
VPERVVPVGVPFHIKLRSADVVHSFYVPRALFKRQAIPGTTNEVNMNLQRVGLHHGQCAQHCGWPARTCCSGARWWRRTCSSAS